MVSNISPRRWAAVIKKHPLIPLCGAEPATQGKAPTLSPGRGRDPRFARKGEGKKGTSFSNILLKISNCISVIARRPKAGEAIYSALIIMDCFAHVIRSRGDVFMYTYAKGISKSFCHFDVTPGYSLPGHFCMISMSFSPDL
jgi:hypothetical protein